MASFGDSFLDMAEAMLGKYNRSSSFDEVLTVPGESASDSTPGLKRVRSDEDTDASTGSSNNSDPQNNIQINTPVKMDDRSSVVVVTPPKRIRRMTGNYSTADAVRGLNRAMSKVSPNSVLWC